MAYDIELVCLGFPTPREVAAAAKALNDVQAEFRFHIPPPRLAGEGLPYAREEYVTSDIYQWIDDYRRRAGGYRPFTIAVVSSPLRSLELGNLFGSHRAEGGVAVFTLHDHLQYVKSTIAYCAYYMLRYAISFVSPAAKAHDDPRRCFFDKKIDKNDLRGSVLTGRFCDPCMQTIQKDLNPEIYNAISAMAVVVKELEMSERRLPDIDVESRQESDGVQPGQWAYGLIALIALAVAIGLLVFMVKAGDTLQRLGLSHRFFFFLLIPLGMSAGAFAFGVMRSYARFSGKTSLHGNIEAGGVVVAMAALIVAGYCIVPPEDTFNVLARVSCAGVPLVSGSLLLQVDAASYSQPINGFGEAHFSDVPTKFRSRTATLTLGAPGFRLHEASRAYTLQDGLLAVETEKDLQSTTTASGTSQSLSTAPSHAKDTVRLAKGDHSGPEGNSGRTKRYRVNLLIPTSLSSATVTVDGREALIVARTSSVIEIDVPVTSGNHEIKLEQNGFRCATTVAILEPTTLTPCQPATYPDGIQVH